MRRVRVRVCVCPCLCACACVLYVCGRLSWACVHKICARACVCVGVRLCMSARVHEHQCACLCLTACVGSSRSATPSDYCGVLSTTSHNGDGGRKALNEPQALAGRWVLTGYSGVLLGYSRCAPTRRRRPEGSRSAAGTQRAAARAAAARARRPAAIAPDRMNIYLYMIIIYDHYSRCEDDATTTPQQTQQCNNRRRAAAPRGPPTDGRALEPRSPARSPSL